MLTKRNQIFAVIGSLLLGISSIWGFIGMARQQHTRFVENELAAAADELQKSPPGLERAERFVHRLKTVNTDYAPAEVKRALNDYVTTMERAIAAMKHGEGTTQYDQSIAQKKQVLMNAIEEGEKYQGFP